jgi:hypothetical protein
MFLDGWMDGWVGVKAVLRIAYSNQKTEKSLNLKPFSHSPHEQA